MYFSLHLWKHYQQCLRPMCNGPGSAVSWESIRSSWLVLVIISGSIFWSIGNIFSHVCISCIGWCCGPIPWFTRWTNNLLVFVISAIEMFWNVLDLNATDHLTWYLIKMKYIIHWLIIASWSERRCTTSDQVLPVIVLKLTGPCGHQVLVLSG